MAEEKKISLTSEEAIERFGGAMVQFSSYYKYSFVFGGEIEGKRFSISIGGSHDDVYDLDVDTQKRAASDLIAGWLSGVSGVETEEQISIWSTW